MAQYSHPNHIGCLHCKEILLTARKQLSSLTAHPPDEYLVSSVRQFLFQPALSRPNQTCIQHTMRFTTWSTFTNALIISTVALLSLIQAANAQASAFVGDSPIVYIISPNGIEPASYNPGAQMLIQWYVLNRVGSHGQDRSLTV